MWDEERWRCLRLPEPTAVLQDAAEPGFEGQRVQNSATGLRHVVNVHSLFLLEELPVTWKVSEQTNNDKKTRGGLAKKAKAVFRGLGKQGVKVKCGRLERAVGSRGAAGGQGLRAELLGQLGAGDVSSCPAAPFLAFGALWHSGAADPVGLLGWYARDCSEAEEAALLGVIWCDLNETAMRAI